MPSASAPASMATMPSGISPVSIKSRQLHNTQKAPLKSVPFNGAFLCSNFPKDGLGPVRHLYLIVVGNALGSGFCHFLRCCFGVAADFVHAMRSLLDGVGVRRMELQFRLDADRTQHLYVDTLIKSPLVTCLFNTIYSKIAHATKLKHPYK